MSEDDVCTYLKRIHADAMNNSSTEVHLCEFFCGVDVYNDLSGLVG